MHQPPKPLQLPTSYCQVVNSSRLITELDLSGNKISTPGSLALAAVLGNRASPLRCLSLSHTKLQVRGGRKEGGKGEEGVPGTPSGVARAPLEVQTITRTPS